MRQAWSVVDLGFGDAGKGATTDVLCRTEEVDRVVRFNGGAQAGHNVVTPDGRHHTFSQFGAGTFAGVPTLLGPDFLFHPLAAEVEAAALAPKLGRDPFPGLWIHRQALVITPFQQAANHARELARGERAHGTCGVGVGECVQDGLEAGDSVRVGDLSNSREISHLLHSQRERKRAELLGCGIDPGPVFADHALVGRVVEAWTDLADRLQLLDEEAFRGELAAARGVVFEGAQGVLLDETWGFHPHTTWSDCTGTQLGALWDGPLTRLGVLRTYQTRHGAGPLPTGGTLHQPEVHNDASGWQGSFRTGALDGVLLRYALDVIGGVDGLALTHLDRLDHGPVCTGYRGLPDRFGTDRLVPGRAGDLAWREELGQALRAVEPVLETVPTRAWVEGYGPVVLEGRGPSAAAWRRVGDLTTRRTRPGT